MPKLEPLCAELGDILGGKARRDKGTCRVEVQRTNINILIMGIPSPAFARHMFVFQRYADNNRGLNTGELVVLQEEVTPVIGELSKQEIIVAAIDNHWIYDDPRLIYVHVQAIMRPRTFARKIAEVLGVLDENRLITQSNVINTIEIKNN
ncbi:MAG TPA: DUF1259 domain-containing protein [Negativicutes bacterium]